MAQSRLLGEEHESSIVSLFNMANLLAETRSLDRALALFERCHTRSKRTLGERHATTVSCSDCIARCKMQLAFQQMSSFGELGHMFS